MRRGQTPRFAIDSWVYHKRSGRVGRVLNLPIGPVPYIVQFGSAGPIERVYSASLKPATPAQIARKEGT